MYIYSVPPISKVSTRLCISRIYTDFVNKQKTNACGRHMYIDVWLMEFNLMRMKYKRIIVSCAAQFQKPLFISFD